MKISHGLYIAAGVVLLADMVSGYQAAASGTGVAPTWFSGTVGAVENNIPLPFPLWAILAGTGVALHYAGK